MRALREFSEDKNYWHVRCNLFVVRDLREMRNGFAIIEGAGLRDWWSTRKGKLVEASPDCAFMSHNVSWLKLNEAGRSVLSLPKNARARGIANYGSESFLIISGTAMLWKCFRFKV